MTAAVIALAACWLGLAILAAYWVCHHDDRRR